MKNLKRSWQKSELLKELLKELKSTSPGNPIPDSKTTHLETLSTDF